jgi:ankyrin repeat protein
LFLSFISGVALQRQAAAAATSVTDPTSKYTPLHFAAVEGDAAAAAMLLRLSVENKRGQSTADASRARLEILGASTGRRQLTPLMIAAMYGHIEVAQVMLAHARGGGSTSTMRGAISSASSVASTSDTDVLPKTAVVIELLARTDADGKRAADYAMSAEMLSVVVDQSESCSTENDGGSVTLKDAHGARIEIEAA